MVLITTGFQFPLLPHLHKKYYLELLISNKYTECSYSVHPFLLNMFKRKSALSHAGLPYLEQISTLNQ